LFPGSIKLQRLPGKTFAFLDFASHSAASLGMDSYVSNPEAYSVGPSKLSVGWSKSGGDNKRADGDANSSCWFCLASPSAKLHLVVSVSDNMYLALPRGGCNEWHVLIVPVECTSSRVQLSPAACGDLCRYESALEKLFVSKEMSSIRFERSMRTRGNKDHMQVQVVPLKRGDTQHALPAFMTAAGKYNLKFHEIPTGVSLEEALGHTGNPTAAIDGTTHEEYFYIELPISGSVDVKRRFVHVKAAAEAHSGRDGRGGFPMHFGMEVAANAMGRPERANWKNSLLSEAEEEQLAERFRDAFQKYDFT
ncbi:cwf19l1, partial [Symbiodinium microadriaticum]